MPDQVSPPTGSARPLRVAVLSRAVHLLHGYGGLERHVEDLVRHLLARGVVVTLITRPPARSGAGATGAPLAHPQLDCRFVPYRTFPLAGRRGTTVVDRSSAYLWFGYRAGRVAASLAAEGRIDLVHGLGASSLGYALARRRRPASLAPFVFNPQGLEEFGGDDGSYGGSRLKAVGYAPLRAAVRACARAADRVLATDRAIEPLIRDRLQVPGERIRLVPNAIDLEALDRLAACADTPRVSERLPLGPRAPVLLSVGRIEQNKGFHVLADALAIVGDIEWQWVLVGDGPFRPALARRVAERGLASRVTLAGRVETSELHAWYEAATLFVHPTLYEGSSLVTLEAMGHRRAVVASAAGGLPDKVLGGVTGWLVPPGDASSLAAALRTALADQERLPAMGREGRALVEREFAWPAVASRLLAVYEELRHQAG